MAGDGDDHREGPLQSLKPKAIDDYEEEEKMEQEEDSELNISEMDIVEQREALLKQQETIEEGEKEEEEEKMKEEDSELNICEMDIAELREALLKQQETIEEEEKEEEEEKMKKEDSELNNSEMDIVELREALLKQQETIEEEEKEEEEEKMKEEDSELNISEMGIDELREVLLKQQETIDRLKYELDEERNASGVAVIETLAMIQRLQREKYEMEMQASQSKRIQEHTEREKKSLEYLLDKRDYVIEALQAELRSLKQRMQMGTSVENHSQDDHKNNDNIKNDNKIFNGNGMKSDDEKNCMYDNDEVQRLIQKIQSLEEDNASMQDSLSKIIQATEQEKRSLQYLLEKKDELIEALQSELQSFKQRMQLGTSVENHLQDDHNNSNNINVNVNGMESDEEKNCMFSVADDNNDEVQQLIQKIQSLEEDKASMALTIQFLKTKNTHLIAISKIMSLSYRKIQRAETETQLNPVKIQNITPISTSTKSATTPRGTKMRRFGMALLHASIWVAIFYSEIRSRFK